MKKITILLLILITLFSGCSKKKDGLNKSTINLHVNERYQLKFKGDSDMPVRWSSDDSYVAEVTNLGEVIANKVGQTTIYANQSKCQINVIPRYNVYDEPIRDWGLTKKQLYDLWKAPDQEDGNVWGYYDDFNENVELIIYYFDNNNRLFSSTIVLFTAHTKQWKELVSFLDERYVLATNLTSDDYDLIYLDAFDLDNANTIIGVGDDIIYQDYSIIDYISMDNVIISPRGNDEIKLNIPNREEIIKKFIEQKKLKNNN